MTDSAISLLKELIATPSHSREETGAADIVAKFLNEHGMEANRFHNNVWCVAKNYNPEKPILMLNSHIDTVRPCTGWSIDPYTPLLQEGRLYGLGSNDAGASAVSLIATFLHFYHEELPFNLLLAITAEEEVGGENGMRAFLPHLAGMGMSPDMVLVGEPTGMQPAVAERGLVVLDCKSTGKSGHAARNEGVNAIYKAIADIEKLRTLKFPKESATLGPIGISVTMIQSGTQHNVVPDECRFVADVRTTDAFSNEETVAFIRENIESEAVPRSTRVWASVIPDSHPMVRATKKCGRETFVSPTTSDMSLMHNIPSLKMGPGDSSRSHRADEYIETVEIAEGINIYKQFILSLKTIIENGNQTLEQGH